MYSDYRIIAAVADLEVGVSIATHVDLISGTSTIVVIPGNYVTISSLW